MRRQRGTRLPAVSVVIPTHNRSALLRRTLRTVLDQQGVDLEVVLVDDGSSDDTAAMVAAFGDARITTVRHEVARGVSAARNQGIACARGEWIAFLDDDDVWAPTKLGAQLAETRSQGCGWGFVGAVLVSPQLEVLAGGPPPSSAAASRWLAWRNMVPAGASNVLVRRDLLERTGGFDGTLRHMSDWDLWIRLAQLGPAAVVARPLLAYVLHAGNASADISSIPAELAILDARYQELRGGAPADRAYVYRWIAWNALRTNKRREALQAYGKAVWAGDIGSAARALAGVVYPGIVNMRSVRPAGADWARAAESWLAPLRNG